MRKFLLSFVCLMAMALPSLAVTKTYQLCTDESEILNPDNQFIMATAQPINGKIFVANNAIASKGAKGVEIQAADEAPQTINLDADAQSVGLFSFKENGEGLYALYESTGKTYWGGSDKTDMVASGTLPTTNAYKLVVGLNDNGTIKITSKANTSTTTKREFLFYLSNGSVAFKNYASQNVNTKDYSQIFVYKEIVIESKVAEVDMEYTLDDVNAIVTLSCPTEGATIYYGFSESEMTNEYSEPFRVTENCTVYAYAKMGDDESIVKSLSIELPFTNFRDVLTNSSNRDVVQIVGDFEIIYEKGNRLILTDGVSNLNVYAVDIASEHEIGDKISSIEGSVTTYNSCFRLVDATLTEGGNGASYTPVELTSFEGLNYDDNLFDVVSIKGCTISGKDNNAPMIEIGEETIPLYDVFGNGFENGVNFDLRGIVWRNKDVLVIAPIEITGGEVIATVETPVIEPNTLELNLNDEVTITCATEGAVIYYTLDGEDPTQESEKYSNPIEFTTSCTIKARAFYEGEDKQMLPSAIAERTYHVFDPTCNVISIHNHQVGDGYTMGTYAKHTCTVDGVDYAMNAAHMSDKGNGAAGSANSIMINNSNTANKERFCYVIQTSENVGYIVDQIELAYNNSAKTIFAVRGANTPFDDSPEAYAALKESIENHGTLVGSMDKDNTSIKFEKEYKYFAIYPTNTGAVYLDHITIRYREPAPLTAPALTGLDEESVMYDEEENQYLVMLSEPIEIDFDFNVDENPEVEVRYVMVADQGGIAPLAEGDDDIESQFMVYEGDPIEISASCFFQYWAANTKTNEESEKISYKFDIDIPLVAPAITGLDDVEVVSKEGKYLVESDHALTIGFDMDGMPEYVAVGYMLAFEGDDEEPSPEMFYPDEPIVLDRNCTLTYFAADIRTMGGFGFPKMSEMVVYEFYITIPEPLTVPAMKGLEDAEVEELMENVYQVTSDKALELTFDFNPDEADFAVVYMLRAEDSDEDADQAIYDGTPIVIEQSCGMTVYAAKGIDEMSAPVSYIFTINTPAPVIPASPKMNIEGNYNLDGDFLNSEEELIITLEAEEGIDIYYAVETKEVAAAKVKAMAAGCTDEHAGFKQHAGETITLTGDHKSFSFFACDPATGAHSEPVTYTLDVATGISGINADDPDTLYFNLNGIRIDRPENGPYIRVSKGKSVKVVK